MHLGRWYVNRPVSKPRARSTNSLPPLPAELTSPPRRCYTLQHGCRRPREAATNCSTSSRPTRSAIFSRCRGRGHQSAAALGQPYRSRRRAWLSEPSAYVNGGRASNRASGRRASNAAPALPVLGRARSQRRSRQGMVIKTLAPASARPAHAKSRGMAFEQTIAAGSTARKPVPPSAVRSRRQENNQTLKDIKDQSRQPRTISMLLLFLFGHRPPLRPPTMRSP